MSVWLALLVIVAAALVAATSILVVRRWAPPGGYFSDSDRAAGVFGVLGTAFAVLSAFVILLALEGYGSAKETAGKEAVAVTQLHRTAALLPEPARSTLTGDLVCYARSVVEDEWRIMGSGGESTRVQHWLDAMNAAIAASPPRTAAQTVAVEQWFDRDSERREGRRGRLAEAESFVPPVLWLVLILGSLVVIGYMVLFADPSERAPIQAAMIATVTTLVVSGLLVVALLDSPYGTDAGSVRPTELERTLRLIGTDAPAPCDARGVPRADAP